MHTRVCGYLRDRVAMKEFNLRTMFRARLRRSKNPEYLQWLADRDKINEGHHWTGSEFKKKLHDLLICKIPSEVHKKIENGIPVEGYSEEELLLNAVELNHLYIEYLQQQIRELKQ
jgi:hypothetical protein